MIKHHFKGRVLTIAGTDPTCGAGMPLDIRMINHLGGIPQAAVSAITVQDTAQVSIVHPLPGNLVAQQMRAALDDIGVDCIKLGMLATADIVTAVVATLELYPNIPIVADPVLAGTGGGVLLDPEGLDLWRRFLLPRVTLVTPNLPEAHILVADRPQNNTFSTQESLAAALASRGCSVLLKGGHAEGMEVVDLLWHQGHATRHRHPRLPGISFHGTGCALAAAIATFLAFGLPLEEGVEKGLAVVLKAMENGSILGRGQRLLKV
ncbi:MAG: Bifunctional hydroxymethylpyrimidine kinase/phosphomethylpyrimidine kinase [Magnetococcales bacterium]|nr:Bifunctional hydroxymethylpyrimidine kinase/phosphomethylpyrimidine kinase [Magnetococcales bacterium]HIJ85592.1 hydroxymethylpyrimidine/phosphomethylpyrimidine kinase [Magnetococcales bacterium]